jgi:hypothetical protein
MAAFVWVPHPGPANVDLGTVVATWPGSDVPRAVLGQTTDLIGLQPERLTAAHQEQCVSGDIPAKMIAEAHAGVLPVFAEWAPGERPGRQRHPKRGTGS